jgi:hypothetical protein
MQLMKAMSEEEKTAKMRTAGGDAKGMGATGKAAEGEGKAE